MRRHLDQARAFASQKRKLVAGDRMKSTRQTVWSTSNRSTKVADKRHQQRQRGRPFASADPDCELYRRRCACHPLASKLSVVKTLFCRLANCPQARAKRCAETTGNRGTALCKKRFA
jgi:hypothetical protein